MDLRTPEFRRRHLVSLLASRMYRPRRNQMDLRTTEFRRRHLAWQIPILECKRLSRRLRQQEVEMCTFTLEGPTRRLRQDQLGILTLATRVRHLASNPAMVIGQNHLVTLTLPRARAIELFCVLTKILPSHNAFPPKNTRANRVFQYSSTIPNSSTAV
jgi:hypothetical protein